MRARLPAREFARQWRANAGVTSAISTHVYHLRDFVRNHPGMALVDPVPYLAVDEARVDIR